MVMLESMCFPCIARLPGSCAAVLLFVQERPNHPNPVIQEVLRSSKSNLPGFQKVRSALSKTGCPCLAEDFSFGLTAF